MIFLRRARRTRRRRSKSEAWAWLSNGGIWPATDVLYGNSPSYICVVVDFRPALRFVDPAMLAVLRVHGDVSKGELTGLTTFGRYSLRQGDAGPSASLVHLKDRSKQPSHHEHELLPVWLLEHMNHASFRKMQRNTIQARMHRLKAFYLAASSAALIASQDCLASPNSIFVLGA